MSANPGKSVYTPLGSCFQIFEKEWPMNSFLKGTILLIAAAFIGECVEFFINMVLARELGENGLGMYMSILPTVFLIVLLASFEMPVSISKFVAEKDKRIHQSMLSHVLKWTII